MLKRILIIGHDTDLLQVVADALSIADYQIKICQDPDKLFLESICDYDLIIAETQINTHINIIEFLQNLNKLHKSIPVLMLANDKEISLVDQAINLGVIDYLVKPFDLNTLVEKVVNLFITSSDETSTTIPVDKVVREIYRLARKVAHSDLTVMVSGESGTGKEILSKYIHQQSIRSNKNMVSINCAAIPETMLESILFGYEKGAFTGANQAYAGKFEQANGGTLLLDEITEMDINLQSKLLRVLQERQVERLGSKKTIDLDIRIIATTNRNLREEVEKGRFREDLMYRLNVFPLMIPPLRNRKMDIIPLANELLRKHKSRCGFIYPCEPLLSSEAKEKLINYTWPGNIRELENVIQRTLIMTSSSVISSHDIIFEKQEVTNPSLSLVNASDIDSNENALTNELQLTEQEIIINTLVQNNGSRKSTAEKLGISPRTLRYKISRMRDLGIDIPRKGAA